MYFKILFKARTNNTKAGRLLLKIETRMRGIKQRSSVK